MADENVRRLGAIQDFDGRTLAVGVDYDTVTIGIRYRLTRRQCLAFGRLMMAAYGAASAYAATHADEEDPAALAAAKWCGVCDKAGHSSDEHDAQAAVNEVIEALRTRLASDATRPDL